MEQWQFKFPTWEVVKDTVWVFESRSTLLEVGGPRNVSVHRWIGNVPVARMYHDGVEHIAVRCDIAGSSEVAGGASKTCGEKSGGSCSYYVLKVTSPTSGGDAYTAECNDIIEALGMTFAEGNIFKALWRSCAERTLGKKKAGGDAVYDAEKMVFFSTRVLQQRKESNEIDPTH